MFRTTFTVAALTAASLPSAQAWNQYETWTPMISQEEFERHQAQYQWVAKHIERFIEAKMPPSEDLSENNQMGAVASCAGCQGGMKLVQKLLRDEWVQVAVERLFDDLCWLATSAIDHTTCSLYVLQAAPTIMNQLSEFLLSPEYTCEVELGYCAIANYKKLSPLDFAQEILSTKPAYLASDNYIDFLYK